MSFALPEPALIAPRRYFLRALGITVAGTTLPIPLLLADTPEDRPDTLFYLDPPYWGSETSGRPVFSTCSAWPSGARWRAAVGIDEDDRQELQPAGQPSCWPRYRRCQHSSNS
jgi:hypothetical protein